MAEVIPGFKFDKKNFGRSPTHKGRIDWQSLSDGKAYRLLSGVDFGEDKLIQTVRTCAHAWARRNGFTCRTQVESGRSIIVRFYREN